MKITRGFVAVQPDGQFLYVIGNQGPKGHMVHVSVVADIDDATIRNNPGPRDRNEHLALSQYNVRWVPVQVRREVLFEQGSMPA